jgi:hypothetical protein
MANINGLIDNDMNSYDVITDSATNMDCSDQKMKVDKYNKLELDFLFHDIYYRKNLQEGDEDSVDRQKELEESLDYETKFNKIEKGPGGKSLGLDKTQKEEVDKDHQKHTIDDKDAEEKGNDQHDNDDIGQEEREIALREFVNKNEDEEDHDNKVVEGFASGSGKHTGIAIGAIVAGIVILILAVVGYFLYKKHKAAQEEDD